MPDLERLSVTVPQTNPGEKTTQLCFFEFIKFTMHLLLFLFFFFFELKESREEVAVTSHDRWPHTYLSGSEGQSIKHFLYEPHF